MELSPFYVNEKGQLAVTDTDGELVITSVALITTAGQEELLFIAAEVK